MDSLDVVSFFALLSRFLAYVYIKLIIFFDFILSISLGSLI
jgi:hypothetical protein